MKKIVTPTLGVNAKSFMWGKELEKVAEYCEKVAVEKDITITMNVSPVDIFRISKIAKHVLINAQAVDGIEILHDFRSHNRQVCSGTSAKHHYIDLVLHRQIAASPKGSNIIKAVFKFQRDSANFILPAWDGTCQDEQSNKEIAGIYQTKSTNFFKNQPPENCISR